MTAHSKLRSKNFGKKKLDALKEPTRTQSRGVRVLKPKPERHTEEEYSCFCVWLQISLGKLDSSSAQIFRRHEDPASDPGKIRFKLTGLDTQRVTETTLKEQLEEIKGISPAAFAILKRIFLDKVLLLFSDAFLSDYCPFIINLCRFVLRRSVEKYRLNLKESKEKALLEAIIPLLNKKLKYPNFLLVDTFVKKEESLINTPLKACCFTKHFRLMLEIEHSSFRLN